MAQQDKKKRKASDDQTKPKRQKMDSAFLDLFWQLALSLIHI